MLPSSRAQFGKRIVLPGVGAEYEDGYEVKWVSMRNIELDDIGPSVEELTRYNQVVPSWCESDSAVQTFFNLPTAYLDAKVAIYA